MRRWNGVLDENHHDSKLQLTSLGIQLNAENIVSCLVFNQTQHKHTHTHKTKCLELLCTAVILGWNWWNRSVPHISCHHPIWSVVAHHRRQWLMVSLLLFFFRFFQINVYNWRDWRQSLTIQPKLKAQINGCKQIFGDFKLILNELLRLSAHIWWLYWRMLSLLRPNPRVLCSPTI